MENKKVTFEELKKLNKQPVLETKIRVIPVEVYSRVVGYYQQISQWNAGKREEEKERKMISLTKFKKREAKIEHF